MSTVLTRNERGDRARISDEYIQLPKALEHALHSDPDALHVAHVRSEHKHIHARHGSDDQVPCLVEGIPGARHDRNRSARPRVLQRGQAPEATRSARDKDDLSIVGPRGV